jgi:hypothetical protein
MIDDQWRALRQPVICFPLRPSWNYHFPRMTLSVKTVFNVLLNGVRTPFPLQCVLLSLLVIGSPFAMSFTPYYRIYTDGVWNAVLQSDPTFYTRAIFILGGMLGAILSMLLLVWQIAKGSESGSILTLQASMALCSVQIGWVAFPYWVNGVFRAATDRAPGGDLDPSALMPGIWIGGIWVLTASLAYMLALALIIGLFVFNINSVLSKRTWRVGLVTILCLVLTFTIFYLTPNYMEWLAD